MSDGTSHWRSRCPNGHVSFRRRSSAMRSEDDDLPAYECTTCGERFESPEPAPEPERPAWKGEVVR